MDNIELSRYRLARAEETLIVAKELYTNKHYKDAINRSYYAAFFAMRAVFALQNTDFKRHKTLLGNFNKEYISTGKLPKEYGRGIHMLALIREASDYDDFFVVSQEECEEQIRFVEKLVKDIKKFMVTQWDS